MSKVSSSCRLIAACLLLGCSSPLYASRDAASDGGAPRVDPCAPASVIDLAVAGISLEGVTRISFDARTLPDAEAPLAATCGRVTHAVVFRYTPTLSRWLRVSTDNPGTDVGLDTVAWATDVCGSSTAASSWGCDDDQGSAPRPRASAFTSRVSATSGVPVFIGVGTLAPTGVFELSVTELPPVLGGGTCDPREISNHCIEGFACRAAPGAETGTCVGAAL